MNKKSTGLKGLNSISLISLSIKKTAEAVKEIIIRLVPSLSNCVHALTYDNDPKFAEHEMIDRALETQGYFAHPYSS